MSAIKFIQGVARKSLTKNQGSGITTIPGAMQSEAKAAEIVALLQKAGIPMNQLDDFIRSEADVLKFLNIIEAASKPKVYSGQAAIDQLNKIFPKKGEVIEFPQKRTFKEEIEAMKKSGDIVDPNNLKKNDKVLQRDLFNNSNLNKEGTIMDRITTASNRIKEIQKEQAAMYKPKVDTVTDTITYIKTLEPIKAMKEANSIIARKGKYKDLTPEQSKKILTDTEDHIFQRDPDNLYDYDPEDMAKGGRAGYAVGNQVMPAVDARMQNTYEQNIKLNQIQRNMQDRVRKGSKTQGLEIGQLTDGMYGKPKTEYNLYNPNLKFNEAQSYGAAANMGLRPEQIKAVAYYNTLKNNFGDQGIGMAGPSMGLAQVGGLAPGTNPFGSEKFFKTPAEQFALYQEGLRQQALQGSPEIYFDADKTYDAGNYVSPKGIYTFRDDEFLRNLYNNNNTMVVDGKEYASEQDAIDDMGIERYNQFMAKGGRAGFYTGGITDVEPSLDDIGHGSDSLMARTRLMSPGAQATTSTGLNYLLAEDNDNMRVPFAGGGMGRRAFLKLLASIGGGVAAAKSGILGLGKGGTKKAITETIKQSAGGNYPPPYFFKLVEKIKFMGDDITEKAATQNREIVKRYKDYEMTEDIGTGNIVIKKRNEGSFYDQDGIISDEYIVYKPGQADELTKGKKPPPEYDEYTVRPDSDGKLRDSEDGLDSIDEILEEVGDPDSMTLKKADGGRIGFSGGIQTMLGE